MKQYDFIILGAGAAGLSLALHLVHSPLRDRSILIVDREAKDTNDRTWCFWSSLPTPYDSILYRTWDRLRFTTDDAERDLDIAPYRYNMLYGIDFYRHVRQELARRGRVDFLQGVVGAVCGGEGRASVEVGGRMYEAEWLFDSRFGPDAIRPDPGRYHYLKQHFLGWEVETPQQAFDPTSPTLFDLRLPQRGSLRFIYLLPFAPTRALVEYTVFSPQELGPAEYEQVLRDYLSGVLRVQEYRVLHEERGSIPMTDHPLPRRLEERVMAIGTRGGQVKPSTGYAFDRIQRDSAAIVRSFLAHGHPFAVAPSKPRFRLYDSLMLDITQSRGELVKPVLESLFLNNRPQSILRFLGETSTRREELGILASLPPRPFIQALLRFGLRRPPVVPSFRPAGDKTAVGLNTRSHEDA